jgi:hypothetical protein
MLCLDRISFFPLARDVDCRFFQEFWPIRFGCGIENLDKLIFLSPSANLYCINIIQIRVNYILGKIFAGKDLNIKAGL